MTAPPIRRKWRNLGSENHTTFAFIKFSQITNFIATKNVIWSIGNSLNLFLSGSDDDSAPVEKRAPAAGRRAATSKKVTYSQSSSDEELWN